MSPALLCTTEAIIYVIPAYYRMIYSLSFSLSLSTYFSLLLSLSFSPISSSLYYAFVKSCNTFLRMTSHSPCMLFIACPMYDSQRMPLVYPHRMLLTVCPSYAPRMSSPYAPRMPLVCPSYAPPRRVTRLPGCVGSRSVLLVLPLRAHHAVVLSSCWLSLCR